jgi:hypothetical protein
MCPASTLPLRSWTHGQHHDLPDHQILRWDVHMHEKGNVIFILGHTSLVPSAARTAPNVILGNGRTWHFQVPPCIG